MGAERGPCLRCFLAAVSRHDDLLALFLAAGIEPVHRVRSPAPPMSLPSRLRGRLAAILAAQAGRRPAESSGHRLTQIPLDGAEPTAHVVPPRQRADAPRGWRAPGAAACRAGPPRPIAFFLSTRRSGRGSGRCWTRSPAWYPRPGPHPPTSARRCSSPSPTTRTRRAAFTVTWRGPGPAQSAW